MFEQDKADMEREHKQAIQHICMRKLDEFVSDFLPRLPSENETPDGIWAKHPFEVPPEWQLFAYPRGRVPPDMDVSSVHPMDLYPWMDIVVVLPKQAMEGLPTLPQWLNRPKPATRRESGLDDDSSFKPDNRKPIPEEQRKVGILEVRADSFVELYESVTRVTGNGLDPVRLKLRTYSGPESFHTWLNDPKWDFDLRKLNKEQTKLLDLCFELARSKEKIDPSLYPILFNMRAGKRYVMKLDGVQLTTPAPIQFLTYAPIGDQSIRPVFRHYPRKDKAGAIERRPHLLVLQSFNRLLRIYLRDETAKLNRENLPEDPQLRDMIQYAWDLRGTLLNQG